MKWFILIVMVALSGCGRVIVLEKSEPKVIIIPEHPTEKK